MVFVVVIRSMWGTTTTTTPTINDGRLWNFWVLLKTGHEQVLSMATTIGQRHDLMAIYANQLTNASCIPLSCYADIRLPLFWRCPAKAPVNHSTCGVCFFRHILFTFTAAAWGEWGTQHLGFACVWGQQPSQINGKPRGKSHTHRYIAHIRHITCVFEAVQTLLSFNQA